MSRVKLSGVMIRKNIWLNIFISLFLALSLLSTIFTLLLVIDAKAIIKTYKSLEDGNFVHFSQHREVTENEFKDRINDLEGLTGVLYAFERTLYDEDYKGYNTMEMTKPLIENLNMSMSRGVWLSEVTKADEGIISACVGESLKHLFGKTIVLERRGISDSENFAFKIVGVIDATQVVPSFNSGPVSAFERISTYQKKDLIVFEDKTIEYYATSGLVVFSKDLSNDEKLTNKKNYLKWGI